LGQANSRPGAAAGGEESGPEVRVLAEHEGHAVVLEQGNIVAAAFHPELVGETRLHEYFLKKVQ